MGGGGGGGDKQALSPSQMAQLRHSYSNSGTRWYASLMTYTTSKVRGWW